MPQPLVGLLPEAPRPLEDGRGEVEASLGALPPHGVLEGAGGSSLRTRHRQPSDPPATGVGSDGGDQEGTDRLFGGWGGAPSVSVRPLAPAGGGGPLRTDPHHNTVWNGSFTKERILESMISYCNFYFSILLYYYLYIITSIKNYYKYYDDYS